MVAVDAADLTLGGDGASALGDEGATRSVSSISAASETERRDLLEDVYDVAS